MLAASEGEQRRGEREPHDGERAAVEPLEDELRQGHGEPPEEARGDERHKSGMTAKIQHGHHIFGANRMRLVRIAQFGLQTEYCFVLCPSHWTKSTSDY